MGIRDGPESGAPKTEAKARSTGTALGRRFALVLVVGVGVTSATLLGACPGPEANLDAGPVDGSVEIDGGEGPRGPAAPEAPAAPAAPEAPSRACPPGWTATGPACAPFTTEPRCTGATAALPGNDACVVVGAACPAGDFPSPPAAGRVLYVLAGAPAGGDGSEASPFDRLSQAVAAATGGTTILLSKGAHSGDAELPDGVDLRGACASETSLFSPVPAAGFATIIVDDGEVEVSDLTLTGERPGILAVGDGVRVVLRGVVIEDVPGIGALAQGGAIDAEEVVIRAVRGEVGASGRGADAIRGGSIALRRSMIDAPAGGGMLVSSGGTATLSDVTILDSPGRGLAAQLGAQVTLERVAMRRIGMVALNANDAATSVTARDLAIEEGSERAIGIGDGARFDGAGVWVRDLAEASLFVSDPDTSAIIEDAVFAGLGERGVNAQRSARLEAARVLIEGAPDIAVFASSESEAVITDLTIEGGGRALRAQLGATLTVERASVRGGTGAGLMATDAGTSVTIADLELHDTSTGPDDEVQALGLGVFTGARLMLARADIRRVVWGGVLVSGAESAAELSDLTIAETAAFSGLGGYGLTVLEARVDATRVVIEDVLTIGVGLAFGGRLDARDIVVRRTRVEPSTGVWGRAVNAQGPADVLSVERGVFEESVEAGLFAGGERTAFDLRDVVIRRTSGRPCTAAERCDTAGGVGLVAYFGAAVEAQSFELADNDIAGAQLGGGGEIDLRDGEVRGNRIGVSVATPDYDIERLSAGVRYIDNGVNLDSEVLPVPTTGSPVVAPPPPPED